MKRFVRRFLWPVIIVVLALSTCIYQGTRPVAVESAVVRRGPIEEYVTEEARTQLHIERIVAAELAGTARRISLEEGDVVAAGQVITTIEDTQLKINKDLMSAGLKEIEARLEGVDVPLPKEPEIAAAEQEVHRAEKEVEVLTEEKRAAEANLEYAEADFGRIKGLYDSDSTTDRQLNMAQRDLHVARARLEALTQRLAAAGAAVEVARLRKQVLVESLQDTAHLRRVFAAQIEQIQKRIDLIQHDITKVRVTSPIDGVLLEKYLDSEQFVQPGMPLVKMGDMTSIEIRADILSDEVGRVAPGQKVYLIGRAIRSSNAAGRVKKIYPSGFEKVSSLGVRQQRVVVLVDFDNSQPQLGPGYELDVKITVDAKDDAVLVPSAAVFATADGMAVFAVEKGRARLRPVTTGLRGDDDYEIVSGVKPGEAVVIRPPTDLEEGSRVAAASP